MYVDFTSATVTGLATGGGLVSGTGTNSLQSGITGATGNASSTNSIAIGVDASMSGGFGAAIGVYSEAGGNYANAFGSLCNASATNSLAVGKQATASGIASISIGNESSVTSTRSNSNRITRFMWKSLLRMQLLLVIMQAQEVVLLSVTEHKVLVQVEVLHMCWCQSLANESVAIGGDAVVASNSTGGIGYR